MIGYAHVAYLNVYVDEITIPTVTIIIPRDSITPEDVSREDKRVRAELAKFKIDSRDKAIGHIVCSKNLPGNNEQGRSCKTAALPFRDTRTHTPI